MRGRPEATYCAYHCGGCHRHFTSLVAFERHRIGSFDEPDGPRGPRRCESPLDLEGYELVTEAGVCRMYDMPEMGAVVWGDAAGRQRARERFGENERAAA